MLGADLLETGEVAGVTAVVDPVLGPRDGPGRPEGVLLVAQTPAAEVPRGRGGQTDSGDGRGLVPVELVDPVRGHTPALQVRTHAERYREDGGRVREGADRRKVEVVVVVVRDHHDVDRAEGTERQRRGVHTLGTGEGEGRTALAPHRVEEHPPSVDLGEHAGMPHPGEPEAGGGGIGEVGEGRGVHGHGPGRRPEDPLLLAEIDLRELQRGPGRSGPRPDGVLEDPVGEVGGTADALHTGASRVGPEGGGTQRTQPGAQREWGVSAGHKIS